MKKDYCKPESRCILVGLYSMLMDRSKEQGPYGGGAGEEPDQPDGDMARRFGFWDDFDEDLLQDMDKSEINELE